MQVNFKWFLIHIEREMGVLGYRILIPKENIQNYKFWSVTQQITKSFHVVSISVTRFFVLQFSGVISETCDSLKNLAHWPETMWNKNEIFSNHVMLGLKITHVHFPVLNSVDGTTWVEFEKNRWGGRKGKESEVFSRSRKSNWRVERVKVQRSFYFVSQFGFETLAFSWV